MNAPLPARPKVELQGALRIWGMMRSGNHAIIDWLIRNRPVADFAFLNSCKVGEDPFLSLSHIVVGEHRASVKFRGTPRFDRIFAQIPRRPFLLVSYENRPPVAEGPGPSAATPGFRVEDFAADIVIYRSFLNWLASYAAYRQRKLTEQGVAPPDILRQLSRGVAAYAGFLRALGADAAGTFVPVLYDTWFRDEAYRARILARCGLPVRDNSIGAVQSFAGGSTFEGVTQDAAALATLDRWRQMKDDPLFLDLLRVAAADPAFLADLARHFPEDPARIDACLAGTLT